MVAFTHVTAISISTSGIAMTIMSASHTFINVWKRQLVHLFAKTTSQPRADESLILSGYRSLNDNYVDTANLKRFRPVTLPIISIIHYNYNLSTALKDTTLYST